MRLVVCDDHQLLLQALTAVLTRLGHEVVAATVDPDQAVEAVRRHQPDACLLDVHFPNRSGLSVISDVHAAHSATRIVIMSGTAEPVVVAEAVSKGAHAFVGKDRPVADIVATLERAVAGQVPLETDLPRSGGRTSERSNALWVLRFLTEREWQVLHFILQGRTTEQMASELGVRRSTARTHVQNLLAKLGVHSRLQVAAMMNAQGQAVMRRETWGTG